MAVASSLLPPPDMPIFRNNINCGQVKVVVLIDLFVFLNLLMPFRNLSVPLQGVMNNTPLYSCRVPLSSHSVRQDTFCLYVLKNLHGSSRPRCTQFNGLICQSLSKPGGGNEIPILKAAATIISRSYSSLQGSPLVLQLVPAIGIFSFAAWGLVPLMYLGRTIILNKTDNSWKKSGTYYITNSYLQPLLLWTGAMLICRALDPLILSSISSQAVKQRLLNFVRSLSTVLAFAYCVSSLIQQIQKFFAETKDPADSRNMGFDFAGKAVYTAVWVAAASLFMELLGFSTQKWLTAGGLGTVLLTLAGREILTNFLSSVIIHATRPFVLNDWIQTKIEGYEVSGTVEHVGWWSPTVIRGDDREALHIPSHKFTMNVVRNLTQRTHWRVKTHLAISHLDVNKINNIVADMRKVVAKNPQIEQQKLHRRIFLDNVDSETQALLIMVSCFVKTARFEEYLCVKEALLLDLLRVISHHRARLATPIRTVQKVYGEPDVDTMPFADTIFTRSKAATRRPFLLAGPSYKVNSDDKTQGADQLDEQNVETIAATLISEPKAGPTSLRDDEKVDDNSKTSVTVSTHVKSRNLDSAVSGESESVNQTLDTAAAKEESVVTSPKVSDPVSGRQSLAPSTSKTSSLEDNIVLGVALEGSKMTLPIDEGMRPPPPLSDAEHDDPWSVNELAAVGTDKQDENGEGSHDQRPKRKAN